MKIEKVLNNNVVVSSNGKNEIIVMGRGIAFKKRVGDTIDEEIIDKIFTLDDAHISEKLKTLISSIPMEYFEITERIVKYAVNQLNKEINDNIYITLTDHIHFAIERYKKNIQIKNALLWEIKHLYKEEFEIGIDALNMIFDTFNVILPEDEAGFIALHLVSAQFNEEMQSTVDMTKIIQDILTIVKYHFKMEFDENSLIYHRFITHLKFFANRLIKGNHYRDDQEDDLLSVIKNKYPNAHTCAEKVKKFVEKQYQYELTDEEILYLTIHIERVVKTK